jgi:SAM-dependent methyltransferase
LAVDRSELSSNLAKFYDFRGKSVLYVGAGRGQLLRPTTGVASVVAIDRDPGSLDGFRRDATTEWAGIPIRFVPSAFETVEAKGDTVYFEFCMHYMEDPAKTLEHARSSAQDIVVMDHLPDSEWVYYWAGEEAVRRSTKAIESFGVRRRKASAAEQKFEDWQALATRLTGEGEESSRRVLELKEAKEIRMRMDYCLYLL